MGKSLIFFLSCLCIFQDCHHAFVKAIALDCSDKHIQDSIVKKYIDNGAEKLNNIYNNPAWGSYMDSVIALCPNIAAAYQLKAIPFIKNGEYEKAFALNDKAVEVDPRGYTAYRGFLKCIFTKDYEGALVDFQKAEQLTPDGVEMDHTYPFYEGLCNLEMGHYTRAEENFNQDIRIQTSGNSEIPVHFNTLLYAGILYYEMNNDDKAKDYLLRCLKAYQELPEANYYLGLLYGREGDGMLRKKYLEIARQSLKDGYTMNEDNLYYAYYPHQITLYEVEKGLAR